MLTLCNVYRITLNECNEPIITDEMLISITMKFSFFFLHKI